MKLHKSVGQFYRLRIDYPKPLTYLGVRMPHPEIFFHNSIFEPKTFCRRLIAKIGRIIIYVDALFQLFILIIKNFNAISPKFILDFLDDHKLCQLTCQKEKSLRCRMSVEEVLSFF
jgi:hypothetical protein